MKVKYPRTPHLPWSPGTTQDDKVLKSFDLFEGQEIVITEKMDGENTTIAREYIHARSLDSQHHPSRDYVKTLWGNIRHNIPDNMRICGENVFARHSIPYTDLPDYFLVFNIWVEDTCLSWDETREYAALLELPLVPVLYRGRLSESFLRDFHLSLNLSKQEGYVVRLAASFTRRNFPTSVAKWVRKGHVQTNQHWMHSVMVPNQLRERQK